MRITPAILAGGAGARLWPLSRAERPKQFQALSGGLSLLQETLERLAGFESYAAPVVMTNEAYRFAVTEQAEAVDARPRMTVLEPAMRNTAPAMIALAALVAREDPEALIHVIPSDHAIEAGEAYWAAVRAAAEAAGAGRLVTFGIVPDGPATGYGYIEIGQSLCDGVFAVARFIEKPSEERAAAMLAAGGHFWNSGMFMFRAASLLEEARALAPEAAAAAEAAAAGATRDLGFTRLDAAAYAAAPEISVDYAVFEKTARAAVAPADMLWSDLGAWSAVWKAGARDTAGNLARGPHTLDGARESLVISEGPHVAVQGLEDVAVIASPDAVYVGRLSAAEGVKALVGALRTDPVTAALTESHRTTYRPWGGYASVLSGEGFQVKRLFVKPGAQLSLQKHYHRAEHWVVVRGTAEATIGEEVRLLTENQSTYISPGTVHRLANPGRIQLELIEVQSGTYLGEDDIVRLEDDFGRR